MIVFNGVSLDSIAPVKVEDIRVNPIQLSPVTRQRAIRFGADFVRMAGGTRTVSITLAVLDMNKVTRHEALMNLSHWAKTDREYMLELPQSPNMCLYAVCTAKPEPSVRQWWESKLRLTFTCISNPYWTSKTETSVSCGTQFNALGDAPPLMRIENTLAGSASNQTYSNGTESMTFTTIPSGDLIIDLNMQTAEVGGTSIMQYYTPSGSFLIPRTGVQTISGTGTVKFRERFE